MLLAAVDMMVETGVEYFFIDGLTVIVNMFVFLAVILIFGSFFEHFLRKVFKVDKSYEEIPFLIRMNIKIVLGVLFILVIGSIASVFSMLNQFLALLVITIITSIWFIIITRSKWRLHNSRWTKTHAVMLPVIFILILGVVVRLLTLCLNGVIFPGDDVKFHSMLVELICFNRGFSETLEPFVHQIAAYPPGFHMIVSFFSSLTGQLSTKVITIFICFVYSLVGLGFYSLAYALSKSKVASFVSALSVLFLNGEISLITLWGGVTLLLALYFTSTFLSLIYFDFVNFKDFFYCIAGISFTVAFVTNTGLALMGLVFLIPFLFKNIRSKLANIQTVKINLKSVISPFLTSSFICIFLLLPLILPSIRSAIGLVSADLMSPKITDAYTYGADWFSVDNFVPRISLNHGIFMAMVLMVSAPFLVILLSIYFQNKNSKLKAVLFSYFTIFCWIFTLIMFGVNNPQGMFFFEFPLWDLFVPSRIFTFLILPLCVLAGLLFQLVFDIIRYLHSTNFGTRFRRLTYVLLAVFLALSIGIAYMDTRANQLTESMGESRVAISINDLECFDWIKGNTRIEDRFLVETSDAGQYISSFCDRPVVFPFTLLQYDSEYRNLKEIMYLNPDDDEALNLLNEFKISYVFVGSKATRSPFITFDADILLASSHYQLAFSSNGSFIFRVKLNMSD
jgi:hypothetical protein